jgi:hypothetical protein
VTLQRTVTITDFSVPLVVTVPYDRAAAYVIGPTGLLWAEGREYEIREYDSGGGLSRVLRVAQDPQPVTEADIERQAEACAAGAVSMSEARAVVARMDIPSHRPTFSALKVSPNGWVFAELFRNDESEPARWVTFDPDGNAHGYLEVPPELTVHHIGDDHLLGVRENAFGVELVVRYPLGS